MQDLATVCIRNRHHLGFGVPWGCPLSALFSLKPRDYQQQKVWNVSPCLPDLDPRGTLTASQPHSLTVLDPRGAVTSPDPSWSQHCLAVPGRESKTEQFNIRQQTQDYLSYVRSSVCVVCRPSPQILKRGGFKTYTRYKQLLELQKNTRFH